MTETKDIDRLILKMTASLLAGLFAVSVSFLAHQSVLERWSVLSKILAALSIYYLARLMIDLVIWKRFLKDKGVLDQLDRLLKKSERSIVNRISACNILLSRYQLFTGAFVVETFIRIVKKIS